jgi:hypothetical protein
MSADVRTLCSIHQSRITDQPVIKSEPYSIPRIVLARLTALYYLRTFWFVLLGPFLFGIVLLFVGPNQTARIFGLILAIWPMTVFSRALLLTGKAAKLWGKPTTVTLAEDGYYFESQGEPVSRLKLRFESIRRVIPLGRYLLFQTRRFGFVPIPDDALPTDALKLGSDGQTRS